jgi:hypothetical protein
LNLHAIGETLALPAPQTVRCRNPIDPNLPIGLLHSSRTASHRSSCFASTKRPFVGSHTGHQGAFSRHASTSGKYRIADSITDDCNGPGASSDSGIKPA